MHEKKSAWNDRNGRNRLSNRGFYEKVNSNKSRNRKSLNISSIIDYGNIEEEIKAKINEMRSSCLWEIRYQNYEDSNLFNSNFESDINNFGENNTINKKKTNDENKNNNDNYDLKITLTDFARRKSMNRGSSNKTVSCKRYNDKFRFLAHRNKILDSNDDDESDEDINLYGFSIDPQNKYIILFDFLIFVLTIFCIIYNPYALLSDHCERGEYFLLTIEYICDIVFIIDLILGFFVGFYNKQEKLIKSNVKIAINYMTGYLLFDLLEAIPINSIIIILEKKQFEEICKDSGIFSNGDILRIFKCIKILKYFKIMKRKKNQFTTYLEEIISSNIYILNKLDLFKQLFLVIIGLHILACFHIFIGNHVSTGWIYRYNFRDYSFIRLYIVSIYTLITTMTTVGYGDLTSDSIEEISFQVILLAVGIIAYSWIISSISNSIGKKSNASINYSNECKVLEEIRITHPALPYSLYLETMKYLEYKNFRQKKYDQNILLNSLPYSLKNSLILSMHKREILKFNFFKEISNSNFVTEVCFNFNNIIYNKNKIILNQNELIEEMFFIKEGRLSLELIIDIDNLEESITKYLSKEFLSFASEEFQEISNAKTNFGLSKYGKNLKLIRGNNSSKNNIFLKIHDVHKNEEYGGLFILMQRRSPFTLRAKTKVVDLYTVKKENVTQLFNQYPNVWRRINKKTMHNLKQIKNIMIKKIYNFCRIKGVIIGRQYHGVIKKAINAYNRAGTPKNIFGFSEQNSKKTQSGFSDDFYENIKLSTDNLKKYSTAKDRYEYKNFKTNNLNESNNLKIQNSTITPIIANKNYQILDNTESSFKIHKESKVCTNIKPNYLNQEFKNISFNYSESDDSIETQPIQEDATRRDSNGPNTIKALPQSLKNLLKTKLNYDRLLVKNSKFSQVNKDSEKNEVQEKKNGSVKNINIKKLKEMEKDKIVGKRLKRNSVKTTKIDSINMNSEKIPMVNNQKNKLSLSVIRNKKRKVSNITANLPQNLSLLFNPNNVTNTIYNNSLSSSKSFLFYENICGQIGKDSQIDGNNISILNYYSNNINYKVHNKKKIIYASSNFSFTIKNTYKNINNFSKGIYSKNKNIQEKLLNYLYRLIKKNRTTIHKNKLKEEYNNITNIKFMRNISAPNIYAKKHTYKIDRIITETKSADIKYFKKIMKDSDYFSDDSQIRYLLSKNAFKKFGYSSGKNKNSVIFLRKSSSNNSFNEFNVKSCRKTNVNRKRNKKRHSGCTNTKK